jgi:hypothetical protein
MICGLRVQGSGFEDSRFVVLGFRVQGSRIYDLWSCNQEMNFGIQDHGSWFKVLLPMVEGPRLSDKGPELRVQGLELTSVSHP